MSARLVQALDELYRVARAAGLHKAAHALAGVGKIAAWEIADRAALREQQRRRRDLAAPPVKRPRLRDFNDAPGAARP